MKIERLSLLNFQIHRSFDVYLDDMNVFCGLNRSGKTCIKDAVAFALSNHEMRGIKHKKDLHALVSSGAKKGSVRIEFDSGEAVVRDVGTGKGDDPTVERIDPRNVALFVVNMHAFSRLDENNRRLTLFRLAGVETDPKAICDRIVSKGFNKAAVESIKPLLRSGFTSAEREMRAKAREEKASWRTITGETYGPEKAETWGPKGEHVDVSGTEEKLRELEKEGNVIQAHLNNLMQEVGRHDRVIQDRQSLGNRIVELEPDASMLDRYERNYRHLSDSLLAKDQALADEIATADKLSKELSPVSVPNEGKAAMSSEDAWHSECPSCGTSLCFDEETQTLMHYVLDDSKTKEKLREVELRIKGFRMQAVKMRRQTEDALAQLNKAKSAVSKIEECKLSLSKLPKVKAPDMATIKDLEEKIKAIRAESDDLRAELREAHKNRQFAERAKLHHKKTQDYIALADVLSPGGVQKEMLDEAIGPINDTLSKHSHAAGFPTVRISENMAITIGGMPYSLESESMQWRADAVLSVAFSEISGLGFVVLDRLDVLDIPSRSKTLSWLYGIKESTQSIVMATLKQVPCDRKGMFVMWLEGGV